MGFDPNEPEQRRRLRRAINAAGIPVSELWLRYFGIAGDTGEYEVEAYLQGLVSLPALQRDLLAMAANELIEDAPRPHAPFGDEVDGYQNSPDDGGAAPPGVDRADESGSDSGDRPGGAEPEDSSGAN